MGICFARAHQGYFALVHQKGIFVENPQMISLFVHKKRVFVEKAQIIYLFVHQTEVFVEKLKSTYLFVHKMGVFVEIFWQIFWQTRNTPDVAHYAEARVYASLAHIRDILFCPPKG